jgi:PAS domain S-box-containing protein
LYVHQDSEVTAMTPTQLLANFESGQVNDSTLVSIQIDAPPQPLRRYLRELVWLEYQENYRRYVDTREPLKYQAAFENAPIGMVLSDIAGRIQHVNTRFADLLGYKAHELIGKRVGEISFQDDRANEIELGNRVISGEIPNYQMEKRFVRKDRTVVDTLLSVSLARDVNGSPRNVIAHVVDLTERNHLEHALARQERLAAVGQFAAGVAHDVGNILQVISASVFDIDRDASESNRIAAEAIEEAVTRGAQWTAQLRSERVFEAKSAPQLDIDTALADLENVLRGTLGSDKHLQLQLDTHSLRIPMRRLEFERLILNLVTNAAQAMGPAGLLNITTCASDAKKIEITVTDNGHGMTPEVLEKALEPEFTTRSSGGGTGFGLAFVNQEVLRTGGTVIIESTPMVGTSVTLSWPLSSIEGV